MEPASIFLLVVSASISFGLGRLFVYLRGKKRKAKQAQRQKTVAQAQQGPLAQAISHNKAKRKRQLRDAQQRMD